ncbi:MAG: DUF3800 domain-containing protein [Parachlamydiaceae bacterium]
MYLLYFDEAGCTATLPAVTSPITPMLVITGLIIKADYLPYITREFMDLKKKYFKMQTSTGQHVYHSNWIRHEIKGAEIRKILATSPRNTKRPMTYFLKDVCKMLERNECRLISRVFVKGVAAEFKGTPVYTSTIQSFYGIFQNYLEMKNSRGLIIGDSRDANQNSQVSHSIFSKKMSASGDSFDRIVEMPTFAHSENSAGLQLADLMASGLIWPIAVETFCKNHIQSVHMRNYSSIKDGFLKSLMGLQYRYMDNVNRRQGGIIITNKLSNLPAKYFFKMESDIKSEFPTQMMHNYAGIP